MRWAGLFACVVSSVAMTLPVEVTEAGPRASNPAFLGIQMLPAPQGACLVRQVTADSPAEAAGVRGGDLITAIDGNSIADCTALLDAITAHAPGDIVQLRVARRAQMVTIKAQLTTRDVLLHKAIGKPMIKTNLIGVEDHAIYDLSALHGRMAIVGLYNPECVDCAALFGRFQAWSRDKVRKAGGAQPLVLAVYTGDPTRELTALQKSIDVPLVTSEPERSFEASDVREPSFASAMFGSDLVLADRERLGVLVVDGRGIVQYVGPIAPNSDDTDAALDELFAVADQASRRPS